MTKEAITKRGLVFHCCHSVRDLRFKVSIDGVKMFAWQCMGCGRHADAFLKWVKVPEDRRDSVPPWDKEIEKRWQEDRDRQAQFDRRADDIERERRRSEYESHLRSDKWNDIRRRVIERSGGICEGCRMNRGQHVHHLTYDHLGNELLFELVFLCRQCHELIHPHMRMDRTGPHNG